MNDRVNLFTLIHELGEDYDYIALGDTHHRDPIVRDLRGDLALFEAVREAGYTAFALEKPPEDMFYNQVIEASIEAVPGTDPEEYYHEVIANGSDPVSIVGAFAQNSYDMTAIYPDPRYGPDFNLTLMQIYGVIELAPGEVCDDVFLQAFWNSDLERRDAFVETVRSGDDVIARRIEEQSGGRAFIIYGNGHFSGQNDLNEMLGEDRLAHIAAIASREEGYNPFSMDGPANEPDYPDYIYVVDEDAVLPFDLDDPAIREILENYTSYAVENLDQDTFDHCSAQLPPHLEEHAVTQEQYEEARDASPFPTPGQ